MEAERQELADKINGLQNQIYKNNEKLDQFKMLMNWNQEELEQWALAERQKVSRQRAGGGLADGMAPGRGAGKVEGSLRGWRGAGDG